VGLVFGDEFAPESVFGSGSGFNFGFRFWVHEESTRPVAVLNEHVHAKGS
jgi:hypothetical protein